MYNYNAVFILTLAIQAYAVGSTDPPKFSKWPDVQDIHVGQITQFECDAISLDPVTPTITWFFNKRKVTKSPQFKLLEDAHILQISVSEATEGQYCCVASITPHLSDRRCGALHVQKAPHAIISPTIMSTFVGSSATLYCTVSGRPMPSVSWYVNSKQLKCHGKAVLSSAERSFCSRVSFGENTLTMLDIRLSDIGQYQCSAWNPLGKAISGFSAVTVKKNIGRQ